MLNSASTLKGCTLDCVDGKVGGVSEFYFDDQYWAIRYLVADTGDWLTNRQVLISPYALVASARGDGHISVDLTRKQLEESPSLDSDKPVSRQFEQAYYGYYGWPMYWAGPNMWGISPYISRNLDKQGDANSDPGTLPPQEEEDWDPHLRSTRDVTGHHIQAADGEIGHVEDFIIDVEAWAIRYLVVDTRNWWP